MHIQQEFTRVFTQVLQSTVTLKEGIFEKTCSLKNAIANYKFQINMHVSDR